MAFICSVHKGLERCAEEKNICADSSTKISNVYCETCMIESFSDISKNSVTVNAFGLTALKHSVVQDITVGAGGLGFDSRAGQNRTVWLTAHHCDVSLELGCPGAKPWRWIRHSLHASV